MRKFVFVVISIFITGISFSCNNSSSSSTTTGYTDPVFTTVKTQAKKSYTVAGYTCPSGGSPTDADYKACGAVIYTGTLSDAAYTGIAAGKDSVNPNFNLKIYWKAVSIPSAVSGYTPASGELSGTTYKIQINNGTYIYSTTTDSLNISITSGTDSNGINVYNITFNSSITVSDGNSHTLTINSGDTITAYKWPE